MCAAQRPEKRNTFLVYGRPRRSMQVHLLTSLVASLLLLVGLIQPLAARLRLPPSVLLAVAGILIGSPAYLSAVHELGLAGSLAQTLADLHIGSSVFLYVFLPTLLFQTALTLEVRRMIDDAVPILVLAVVAVVLATLAIGLALAPVSGQSLIVCLLFGAIVATTDPVAVVGIFRDIGAPARLGRLVEGESLLNDAAAITLFTVFAGALLAGRPIHAPDALASFVQSFLGGSLIGYVGARITGSLLRLTRKFPHAQVTLSLALPYVVFVVCEQAFEVSGVVAVVSAGLVLNVIGASRSSPDGWRYLKSIWEQVAFLASSLVFILASLLVPDLLSGLHAGDLLNLGVVILAAFLARAVILFGLVPGLSRLGFSQPVDHPYKVVILWGGLRGAVTLALALAVTENAALPPDVQRFVAVLATGFVLFTLLVQGTTLRPLIRVLRLDQLSPRDLALRNEVVAVTLEDVRESVDRAAAGYRISPDLARDVSKGLAERVAQAVRLAAEDRSLSERDRITLGLICMAGREQQIVLDHFRERILSPSIAEGLLASAGRLLEGALSDGRLGYIRAGKRAARFTLGTRAAQWAHRRFGISRLLEDRLADRFERLMASRIVLEELARFVREKIAPIFGTRVGEILEVIVGERRALTVQALDALRLQYPDYADALERRFLRQTALRREELEYQARYEEGLIGPELLGDLLRQVEIERAEASRRPKLDLGMQTRELVAQFPLFASFTSEQLDAVSRLLRPRLAIPGERLIRRGERGDLVYFVSSGAVEVSAPNGKVRLGRGDFFGEMALLSGEPRNSDVHSIAYCQLLVLDATDFRRLLSDYPHVRERVEAVAQARRRGMEIPRPDPEPVALPG